MMRAALPARKPGKTTSQRRIKPQVQSPYFSQGPPLDKLSKAWLLRRPLDPLIDSDRVFPKELLSGFPVFPGKIFPNQRDGNRCNGPSSGRRRFPTLYWTKSPPHDLI